MYPRHPENIAKQEERNLKHKQWLQEQSDIAHRRVQAYENYAYYAKSDEERAIYRAIWKSI